jgi:hypothetical protein
MEPLIDFREGPRLAASLPVALRFPEGDNTEGWGRLLNLSSSGVKLETRWPLRIGQPLYLTFDAQSEMRLSNLRARVVRVGWDEGYYEGALAFDESVDRAYLKEAIAVLLNRA